MTTPTEAQEAGRETAVEWKLSAGLTREEAVRWWESHPTYARVHWIAAERRARMSGPLFEACKALRKAQDGPGSTWNELADLFAVLATMETAK